MPVVAEEAGPGSSARATVLEVRALEGLPEVRPGDDLAELVRRAHGEPLPRDAVLVVAQKVVSKAEGALRDLREVRPGPTARGLAERVGREAALVEVVLDQSTEVVRAAPGVLIVRTHHGFVCANAGVDASNAPPHHVVLLPADPDASARALRDALADRPAVVVGDSFGRPWRLGQAEVALGCAGLEPLADHRGHADRSGRPLGATVAATADHVAATAELVRAKADGRPVVLLRGGGLRVTDDHGPGAAALIRERSADLFGAA